MTCATNGCNQRNTKLRSVSILSLNIASHGDIYGGRYEGRYQGRQKERYEGKYESSYMLKSSDPHTYA